MNETKFECYALVDPRLDGADQFYRGASRYGAKRRFEEHLYAARSGFKGPVPDRIREILAAGLGVGLVVLSEVASVDELGAEELRQIDEGRASGHPLVNLKRQGWHERPPHGISVSFTYSTRLRKRNRSLLDGQREAYFRRRGRPDPLKL